MIYVYLDPSALVKRYHQERGTKLVNRLFEELRSSPAGCIGITSVWSIAESVAVLNRARNELGIPEEEWNRLLATLTSEIQSLHFLGITDERVLWSIPYALSHNLNSSDALHLKTLLDVKQALERTRDRVLLVASDKRFLRAAQAEGILTFNPEEDTEEELLQLLKRE